MIPCWGKSLLFRIFVGLFFLILCVQCVNASETPEIDVSTPDSVSFSFGPSTEATKISSFRITNTGNATAINILWSTPSGSHIAITPSKNNFLLDAGGYQDIDLTIEVDPDETPEKEDPPYSCTITINSNTGPKNVELKVTVKYNAKITVNRSSIDFGIVNRTDNPSETIRISEKYGYKGVNVDVKPRSGNSWVTSPTSILVPAGGYRDISFQLTPGTPDHNEYSWTFSLSTTTSHTEISESSIDIEAYILMPAKLGKLYDEELEIKFDKPKGTVSRYDRYIDVQVKNEGDEPMYFKKIRFSKSPGGGITIGVEQSPENVSAKSSENIRLHIVAPYDASEGTYTGRLDIDATDKGGIYDAGHGEVDITISIIWPVDFNITSTSVYFTPSPPSIDFGSIELKEQGYEKKAVNITLTEFYLYKPVQNLRLPKSGEYRNWLKEEIDFAEIPPGESRNITLKIEPGLEAVPKSYLWKYDISASEISAKRMEVKAMIVPINIPEMIEYLKLFRESTLYKSYPSSEVIISNGVEMLEVVERSEIGAEDWKKIPILMKGTLSLLLSLNDAIIFTDEKTYGEAVESLWTAWISTSTIGSNSNLNNWDISGYAKDISAGADKTTEEVLMDEAKMLELRGWNIKKAVEHAMAMDGISGLKEEENVLESALSYQYAATIYGLLDDKEKRIECAYEESLLMDKHDELVSDATDLRIKADNIVSNSKENDLITIRIVRIGDIYLLLNPYKYDTFFASYGSAERDLEDTSKKYKVAGELLMAKNTNEDLNKLKGERRYILFLFFIMCILYGVAFIYVINRVIMGTMAYMRDMYEREVGDIMIT